MPFHNLADITQHELFPGYRTRFVHSANMTFSHLEIDAGSPLPEHLHPHEQVATMLEGTFELTVGGETRRVTTGDVAVIPSNVKHSGIAITDCKIRDVFYPIRDDYVTKG